MQVIPLTQNKFAKVDDADYEWLNSFKWHAVSKRNKWYAVRKEYLGKTGGWKNKAGYCYKTIYMHQLITDCPRGMEVDHQDGDSLNNSRANLRICTHMQNLQNRPVKGIASSGYKGVTWDKNLKKWFARITANNQNIYLGYFANKELAAKAYNQAAIKHHGEFARLNDV